MITLAGHKWITRFTIFGMVIDWLLLTTVKPQFTGPLGGKE